jgi:hypothetical protein
MSDAFSTPGAAEAFKYVADFSKEKVYTYIYCTT